MNTYYILWTYIANYSTKVTKVQAKDAQDALDQLLAIYSDDFRMKANVYVFDHPPVLTHAVLSHA